MNYDDDDDDDLLAFTSDITFDENGDIITVDQAAAKTPPISPQIDQKPNLFSSPPLSFSSSSSASKRRVAKPPPDGMPIFGHIYVDFFRVGCPTDPQDRPKPKYFLTHFHSDHYGGIGRSWKDRFLYCTQITANLVIKCLGVDPQWIIPIEIDPTTAIDIGDGTSVTVFDANHCPGSAMFLFRRKGESAFYTGDFRYDPKMTLPDTIKINTLFVDSTYCEFKNPIPSQESVENDIVNKIRSMGDNTLFVIGAYVIGKERIVFHIIETLGITVYLDSERYERYKLMCFPDSVMRHITTDPSDTNVHVASMKDVQISGLREYHQKYGSRYDRIVGVRPTGWVLDECYRNRESNPLPYTVRGSGRCLLFGFPYSEHCSRDELLTFVKRINPDSIIPFECKDPVTTVKVLRGEITDYPVKKETSPSKSMPSLSTPPPSVKADKTKPITNFFRPLSDKKSSFYSSPFSPPPQKMIAKSHSADSFDTSSFNNINIKKNKSDKKKDINNSKKENKKNNLSDKKDNNNINDNVNDYDYDDDDDFEDYIIPDLDDSGQPLVNFLGTPLKKCEISTSSSHGRYTVKIDLKL